MTRIDGKSLEPPVTKQTAPWEVATLKNIEGVTQLKTELLQTHKKTSEGQGGNAQGGQGHHPCARVVNSLVFASETEPTIHRASCCTRMPHCQESSSSMTKGITPYPGIEDVIAILLYVDASMAKCLFDISSQVTTLPDPCSSDDFLK